MKFLLVEEFEDTFDEEELEEAKDMGLPTRKTKYKKNEMGWHQGVHINKNAGNVELGIKRFNDMSKTGKMPTAADADGGSAVAAGSGSTGGGE